MDSPFEIPLMTILLLWATSFPGPILGLKCRDEGDRLDVLTTLVEAYERAHFPMDLPDAVEAIKFRMEQSGLTVKDLEPVIGRKNRVYEVLSRRRALTLRMIEGLHTRFGIPAESLLKQRAQRRPTSRTGSRNAERE